MNIMERYLNFIPGISTSGETREDDLWFVLYKNKILIKETTDSAELTLYSDIKHLAGRFSYQTYLGTYKGRRCFCAELAAQVEMLEPYAFRDLRSLLLLIEEEVFMLCGRAIQIIDWNKCHKYCGCCGSETVERPGERAKECRECGQLFYPRISPAIIVAVTKGDKILLAHNRNFNGDMFSVVAGFVEPGENFEQCVMREVMEETGIKVKNVQYFGSQPWPFPNSLMVAFTAEYEDGEVQPDGIEIDRADWFSHVSLPSVPGKGSVAGKLIHWYLDKYR